MGHSVHISEDLRRENFLDDVFIYICVTLEKWFEGDVDQQVSARVQL